MAEEYLYQSTYYDCSREVSVNVGKNASHIHNWYEILFVLSGRGKLIVEGSEYALVPYGLYLMRVGEAHYFKLTQHKNADVIFNRARIHFDVELLRDIDPDCELLKPFINRPGGQMNFFPQHDENALISVLFRHIEACGSDRDAVIKTYVLAILAQILEQFAAKPHELTESLPTRILNYINHHLIEELSLDGLCQQFFISQSQLIRDVKKATNLTVWQYVILKRLAMARALMENGQSATAAAAASGFKDYSTFYKAYRRHYQVAPSSNAPIAKETHE